MDRKYLVFGIIGAAVLILAAIVAAGTVPHETVNPSVYIVYASEKGDRSYTDSAYQGLLAAQKDLAVTPREFTLAESNTVPAVLANASVSERPGLIITIGFQYANYTQQLAKANPDIRFLAIDMSGIGSGNVRAYEITSYGDSFLAGVLAASATKTGKVGVIMGMKTELLDAFRQGYTDGARAVNPSIPVDFAYVQQDSPDGFKDPEQAGRLAEAMYRNGTDVIYACAGASNLGMFAAANTTPGRYAIGTDSDQSPLGPDFVLASAIKRVDRVVYTGIEEYLYGSFAGGEKITGLRDGATGIVYNPKFAFYNETVSAWEEKAEEGEANYLASRLLQM
ncbi:BMP family ABC transporter substrate-binding protein [Methanoregula sp.]|uniref:BMP family lipoprotein n=1 Tax=Methanoregula sp. TaxID=2052170 RepID=UPI00236E272E|nr:BMP family ABC transporter substrate-binding protein [Methanoregula sp.]MDD1686355.1 BMP family ABC transporter substrate-binding protein [Methanoregula sp.]